VYKLCVYLSPESLPESLGLWIFFRHTNVVCAIAWVVAGLFNLLQQEFTTSISGG
jgi:hypothetical protein